MQIEYGFLKKSDNWDWADSIYFGSVFFASDNISFRLAVHLIDEADALATFPI